MKKKIRGEMPKSNRKPREITSDVAAALRDWNGPKDDADSLAMMEMLNAAFQEYVAAKKEQAV